MDIGSIFIVLAIVIVTVAYISKPLVEKSGYAVTDLDRRTSTLQAQRDQILTVLQDLDMDHAMGKVEGPDYESQRSVLVSRGAAVLKELDLLAGDGPISDTHLSQADIATKALEDQIEDAIYSIKRKGEMSVILVEQYLDFAKNASDAFCILERGYVVQEGPIGDLSDELIERYLTV